MTIVMRLLSLLLISVFIFNIQAMHNVPTQVAQWAEENRTPIVAGSIVGVGGVTAYYLDSPKIFAASVVGAGVYVVCRSLCNDDEFQARLKIIAAQSSQIDGQYKILHSGVDELLKDQKNITASAVQLSGVAKDAKEKISQMVQAVDSSLDVSFLQAATTLPVVVGKTKEEFAKNVSMCNNISANAVEFKKEANAFNAALESFAQVGQKSEEALARCIHKRTARTVKLIDEGTADILKLLDNSSVSGAKLSGSY